MNISAFRDSKYLKKEDLEGPTVVTMTRLVKVNVAMEGAAPDMKYALYFEEFQKPLVMNSTNAQLIAKVVGSDETDDWEGKQIVLYVDPNVSYGGKLIGGIRVRAPKPGQKPAPKGSAAALETQPEEGDPDWDV